MLFRISFILLLTTTYTTAQVPAFPGAQGYGASTPGGRGGQVIAVTNLDDSGPGSFRAAVTARGPRIIIFRVSGTITLRSSINIREPFLTIAGQTAPGGGITLRGENLTVSTNDVIVRFIRVRLGDEHLKENDAVSIASGARNVIFDHVSASWSVDECFSPSGAIRDVTVQWCLISESLWHSIHNKGTHGYGSLLRAVGGVSLHHNLWAHHNGRNPRFGDNYGEGPWPTYDFRNNVIYNWGSYCSGVTDGTIRANYVGNYLKPGPNSSRRNPIYMGDEATPETRFHVASNIVEGRPELTADNSRLFDRTERNGQRLYTLHDAPFETPHVDSTSPQEAYETVLRDAGAVLPRRDSVDERIIHEVRTGTGSLIDTQQQVGGWPELESAPPPLDSDNDGMPDYWERDYGLDPHDPSDGPKIRESGYSNIEHYLNEIAAWRRSQP
ncbi:MAG: hypothetical protein JNL98_15460 [Bryobacterales bacterium]|nr:hypothetical protein [Bryobacterales bacterium]